MNKSKFQLTFLFAIFLSLTIFFGVKLVLAGAGDNSFGYPWSSNTGFMKLNNCDTPTKCLGQSFGVSVLPAAPGTLAGYAWSSNLGWITFNNVGCPSVGAQNCVGGAYADWAHPNSNGTINIKGWAQACSVYASGCSGLQKTNAIRGNWDGYIALGDPTTTSNAAWGLVIDPTTYAMSGYAWGSDVIGWVDFTGTSLTPVTPVTITDFSSDVACVVSVPATPNLSWSTVGASSCALNRASEAAQTVPISSQAAGGTLSTNGKYYIASPIPANTNPTIYTLQCSSATQTLSIPTCQNCPAGTIINTATGQCDPSAPTTCPAGQTLDTSTGKCVPSAPTSCPAGKILVGNKCVFPPACAAGQVFNVTSGQCEAVVTVCPVGQTLDANGQCQVTVCPTGTVLNAVTGSCDVKKKPIFKEF